MEKYTVVKVVFNRYCEMMEVVDLDLGPMTREEARNYAQDMSKYSDHMAVKYGYNKQAIIDKWNNVG